MGWLQFIRKSNSGEERSYPKNWIELWAQTWHPSLYFVARDVAKQSIKPLQDALSRERQFTSYASHELRTPLAVIKGSLEVLVRKPRTQEEYEKKIKENIGVVDNMNRMVDNMLMLTRADSAHFRLIPTEINIKELFTEICSAFSNQIIRRGLHITMNITPDEFTINADRNALFIIVNNLFSNATKYCNDGGEIKLSAYQKDGHTQMEFTNTGRGIPNNSSLKFEIKAKQFYAASQRVLW